MNKPAVDALVVDASAAVEALLGTEIGHQVREHMRAHRLHAPAHLDAEVLSALGRMWRAGDLAENTVSGALGSLAGAPIQRHPLPNLLGGAWGRRDRLRLVDALYVELTSMLASAALLTADARLARSRAGIELIVVGS